MKKRYLILTGIILLAFSFQSFNKSPEQTEVGIAPLDEAYTKGWEDGFCDGWKEVKGQFAICPIVPICPIPKMDCYSGYKCGYIRGLKYGMCSASGGNCEK